MEIWEFVKICSGIDQATSNIEGKEALKFQTGALLFNYQ